MRKILVGLIITVALLVVPMIVSAAEPSPSCNPATHKQTELGCLPTDPVRFSVGLYSVGLGLIGGVGVLFVMYGGYVILSSQGNPEQLRKGKSYIYFAIAGLILAFAGFVLYQTVASKILKIPGFE